MVPSPPKPGTMSSGWMSLANYVADAHKNAGKRAPTISSPRGEFSSEIPRKVTKSCKIIRNLWRKNIIQVDSRLWDPD